MKASTQHLLVGGFTLSGVALALLTLVTLGSGIFRESLACETYFEESVQGLEKGSQVRFRGVKIGDVVDISLSNSKYETEDLLVVVEFALHPPSGVSLEQLTLQVNSTLEEGLHLRLASQGITGTLYLEADLKPSLGTRFVGLAHDWEPSRLYIPSDTSTIQRLSASLSNVMDDLGRTRMHETVDEFRQSLSLFNREFEALRLGELGDKARHLLEQGSALLPTIQTEIVATAAAMRQATTKLEVLADDMRSELRDGRIAGILDNFSNTLVEFKQASITAQSTMNELQGALRGKGRDLDTILADIRELTQNMARLGSTLERYPSWVLMGKPPQQRGDGR